VDTEVTISWSFLHSMATGVTPRCAPEPSQPEVHSSVSVSRSPIYWRRLLGFIGPGFLISVGYNDPGNWATDIAGARGSAIRCCSSSCLEPDGDSAAESVAQTGVARSATWPRLSRELLAPRSALGCGSMAEIAMPHAISPSDRSAHAELLFTSAVYGVPHHWLDVLRSCYCSAGASRYVEALVIALIGHNYRDVRVQMFLSKPEYWPRCAILSFLRAPSSLTPTCSTSPSDAGRDVMPHNLSLHSSIVQSRRLQADTRGQARGLHMANIDSAWR